MLPLSKVPRAKINVNSLHGRPEVMSFLVAPARSMLSQPATADSMVEVEGPLAPAVRVATAAVEVLVARVSRTGEASVMRGKGRRSRRERDFMVETGLGSCEREDFGLTGRGQRRDTAMLYT